MLVLYHFTVLPLAQTGDGDILVQNSGLLGFKVQMPRVKILCTPPGRISKETSLQILKLYPKHKCPFIFSPLNMWSILYIRTCGEHWGVFPVPGVPDSRMSGLFPSNHGPVNTLVTTANYTLSEKMQHV